MQATDVLGVLKHRHFVADALLSGHRMLLDAVQARSVSFSILHRPIGCRVTWVLRSSTVRNRTAQSIYQAPVAPVCKKLRKIG